MKYFKDSENSIYAYELDGSQDEFIIDGLIPINEKEALALANTAPDYDSLVEEANSERLRLIDSASQIIASLEFAEKKGVATDSELKKRDEWEMYRLLLIRIDTSLVPNIHWPEQPQ
ncbi:tail fiber assembly protein [Yersinia ruckeri]|uniref:tail fiber assembly protein n=1 Tax=Yersinia ruckeri TaxID=29486 RepID=UPI0008FEA311|nr:tail fiber assembly protein [Yersinia ruckeri]MCK8585544.1 tail fiber assembly protein [Yersinia ruckeri]OJB82945.1 hypothetical protein A9Q62_10570 [Yersinia ruckeri]OJB86288.1 hypothetical protein A9Q60_16480 [Yersinia ruckeri]UZY11926.1 tail fiber assembly protein [Yersinia ruckeri]